MITLAKNPFGLMATRTADETHLTYKAAALFVANKVYDQALKTDNPAKALDDMCDALPEVMPQVFHTMGTAPALAAVLLPEVANRLWAYTAVEHARAEGGTDYGYVFGVMADALKDGADPQKIRAEVPRVIARVCDWQTGATR